MKMAGDPVSARRVGLIVNPIAGMGGRVGLKGTDGPGTLQQALALGAVPEASAKTVRALEKLLPLKDDLVIVTCAGEMGENAACQLGFSVEIVYRPTSQPSTGEDTQAAAKALVAQGVDLLLFAGGDGTARDIFTSVGSEPVVLGIPAGVKVHSPVYANTPGQAGELAYLYLSDRITEVQEREVLDIDEEAVRQDVLQTSLYGYLKVPFDDRFVQCPKSPSAQTERSSQQAIAQDIVEQMEEGTCYIIGPGTTTRAIMEALDLPFTLLGVDGVLNRQILGLDVAEKDLLRWVEEYPCKLILTPTGGQGYLLGRGNQQISGRVVKQIGKDNVIIVATNQKLLELQGKPLLVDTGDPEADQVLAGYYRVKIGFSHEKMYRVVAG